MRRKMIVLILPIVLFVIIAGSALGTWYFGILSTENQTGAGIEVEGMDPNYMGDVNITNKDEIKIIVHQKGVQLNQQIHIEYRPNGYLDHAKVGYEYVVYVPEKIHQYIAVHSTDFNDPNPTRKLYPYKDPNTNQTTDIVVYEYKGTWIPSVKQGTEGSADTIVYEYNTSLYFSYQPGMKPLTQAEVENILILRGSTILAKFVVTKPVI